MPMALRMCMTELRSGQLRVRNAHARRERTVGVRCHSTSRFPKPVTCGLAKKSDTEVISFLSVFLAIVG